jgi:hypothetical protein
MVFLKPHVVSPSAEEFLLVTGTGPSEPGIGICVNLDGDPTRPTIEFKRYPKEVVVDGGSSDLSSSRPSMADEEEGYILAAMSRDFEDGLHYGLEIQRWDSPVGSLSSGNYWLEPPLKSKIDATAPTPIGIRSMIGSEDIFFREVVDKLCQKRFSPFSSSSLERSTFSLRSIDSRTALSMERLSQERELFERDTDSQDDDPLPEGWETTRNAEEEKFATRLAKSPSRLAVWVENQIWWAVRNPLLLQLESGLAAASNAAVASNHINRQAVLHVLRSFQNRDPKSELEFMTFDYIRQQAGVLLLTAFLLPRGTSPASDDEAKSLENILVDSRLDPRVVLAVIPGLRNEIIEGRQGIWIFCGVKENVDKYLQGENVDSSSPAVNSLGPGVLQFLKGFLMAWRRRKGFGSVADENEVFRTVDASLLLVLLELDQHSPKGLAKNSGSIRSNLYEIVDKGVECFDRAVSLLESYHRLYVLSRLYQSRKMSTEVLDTWRRIIEGEHDEGGELRDGEQRVREYLMKVNNPALVQEYGVWLANRNPRLGVLVFAEDRGRTPKFEPVQVVALLKNEAPGAVKDYLEYLVFIKGHTLYVNDLIAYYLDIVLSDLQSSKDRRDALMTTYEAYRRLQPPKPTYRQFLADTAPDGDEVWQSRSRLLQLLGGAHEYNAGAIRERIGSLPDELLVPEIIILDGRERKHEDALRLLVHHLGDYDTAVTYCLRGGSNVYSVPNGRRESMPTTEQQARLFRAVLGEFLRVENPSDRLEQTGALLERFGGWFEVADVLDLIPDHWPVDIIAGFLVGALRRLVREKHEAMVTRALSTAENLRVNCDLLISMDERGPSIEAAR